MRKLSLAEVAELCDRGFQPAADPPKIAPNFVQRLGSTSIYDRVCQQALLNRLEPIFEPVFDEANFGYRQGRSTKDAMRKVWKEIQSGRE
jgi:retron-type reverse transcriptase